MSSTQQNLINHPKRAAEKSTALFSCLQAEKSFNKLSGFPSKRRKFLISLDIITFLEKGVAADLTLTSGEESAILYLLLGSSNEI